jgi:hypothetical protein
MDPEFEHRLRAQVLGRPPQTPPAEAVWIDAQAPRIPTSRTRSSKRPLGGLLTPRLAWLGVLAPIAAVLVAVLVITGTRRHRQPAEALRPFASTPAAVAVRSAASSSPLTSPERLQQLTASIILSASPSDVQSTVARVAQLAASDGGFVQSSRVQTAQQGSNEADLMLRLPSSKLNGALAALSALASVREENQSSQDITGSYDAARRGLSDALSERRAFLRVLSRAQTQGQIDSVREQLSQAREAINSKRAALHSLSQRASSTELEVTIRGETHRAGGSVTLARGLSDAGEVLTVALVALLLALAGLAPLALMAMAVIGGLRIWRRYQREHALERC